MQRGGVTRSGVRKQHEDVDVGIGRELAASVTAHRDERRRREHVARGPGAPEGVIGGAAEREHQRLEVRRRLEAFDERRLRLLVGDGQRFDGHGDGGDAHGLG